MNTRALHTEKPVKEPLRLAIQKKGRLKEASAELIKECGIHFQTRGSNPLRASASNFPLELLYLRDDDIPGCVADQAAHIGIVGLNVVEEKQKPVRVIERLDFAKCRLSIALPRSMEYQGIEDLNALHIATTYPRLLRKFLDENNVQGATIHEISGSVEIAPSIGLAQGICDLVSSGSTLIENRLKEVAVVLDSEAVLIAYEDLPDEQNEILERLLFRIRAVINAKNRKYILLNAPEDKIEMISKLLPSLESPTVIDLLEPGWKSLHSVVYEDKFWESIDALIDAGAESILVVTIDKLIE